MRIRAFFVASVLILFATQPARAQIDIQPGVRAGANFSTIRVDGEADLNRVTGFHAGAILLIDPAGLLAVQPEVLYTKKGFQEDGETFTGSFTATSQVSYLQVNALGKLDLPLTGPVTPSLFAGPAFAYKLNETFDVNTSPPDNSIDDAEGFKDTDVSAVVGGGFDIAARAATVTVDVRYDIGLLDIAANDQASAKNGTVGVSVGLLF